MNRPSICFVAPDAYGVLAGRGDLARIGGAEVQQSLIARGLVERGYRVSFATLDCGQPDGVEHDGIRVFKTCRWEGGLPGLRFVHPRWTGLVAALRRANADLYYQRTAGVETGQTALWCRWAGRPFVFAAALDDDCTRALPHLRDWRERTLYRRGLRRADVVVAQSQRQIALLRDEYGIAARQIRSCGKDPLTSGGSIRATPPSPMSILWVGRLARQKRPDLLLEIARTSPDLRFDVVGAANSRSEYANDVERRAGALPNVTLHGWIAHAEMPRFFAATGLLLCTSSSEGFPNIFLEAWAHGVPVVSTVDPDGVITRAGLGAVGNTPAELVAHLRRLSGHPEDWAACARRARAHFVENHSVDAAAEAYDTLFMSLAAGRADSRSVPDPNPRAANSSLPPP
ncbi:MAG: glycosyltransferase family 4 protein [Phycisphaerae bacterium]